MEALLPGYCFGRHKLAPRISPGKTWEGVAGGLVLSVTAALLITIRPLGVPWYLAILLGVLIAVAATLRYPSGTLIKRHKHRKDSGQFIPRHGDILDRVDNFLFPVIVFFVVAHLVAKLQHRQYL